MNPVQQFDLHADTYDGELNRALSVSGETKNYFAEKRVEWLKQCLDSLGERPRWAIDYGCGIGGTSCLLRDMIGVQSVVGLDTSERSLELAEERYGDGSLRFIKFRDYVLKENTDLVYCNGVFHHIPVRERPDCIDYVKRCLRPAGVFAFWENNPWNPGTRFIMSRTPFDKDAITLSPPDATNLLRQGGFEILNISYLFFFPRMLKALRIFDPYLSRVPLGGQYQILCRKPD